MIFAPKSRFRRGPRHAAGRCPTMVPWTRRSPSALWMLRRRNGWNGGRFWGVERDGISNPINVVETTINHPPVITIFIGGVNHSPMGDFLLFYPHYITWMKTEISWNIGNLHISKHTWVIYPMRVPWCRVLNYVTDSYQVVDFTTTKSIKKCQTMIKSPWVENQNPKWKKPWRLPCLQRQCRRCAAILGSQGFGVGSHIWNMGTQRIKGKIQS